MIKWFNSLKVRKKILGVFSLLIIFTVIIGYTGILNLNKISKEDKKMYEEITVPLADLDVISTNFQIVRSLFRDMLLNNDPSELSRLIEKRKESSKLISEAAAKLEKTLNSNKEKQLFEELQNNRNDLLTKVKNFESMISSGNHNDALAYLNNKVENAMNREEMFVKKMVDNNIEEGKNISADNTGMAYSSIKFMILIIIVSFIAAILLAYIFYISIVHPLDKTGNLVKEMGNGHLNNRLNLNRNDEFGMMASAMDKFADHLQFNIVSNMKKISDGDFNVDIVAKDNNDEITPALNNIAFTLNGLKRETDLMTEAFTVGKTDYRGDSGKFNGGYKEIVDEFNNTVSQIVSVVRDGYGIMKKLTDGDLTARMDKEYKGNYNWYKNYINNLGESLLNLVSEISTTIKATNNASSEISSSSEEMSAGAQEQSQQTLEVAGAVEEMTTTILETTKNASLASEASKKYGGIAKDGGTAVNETIDGMNKIAEVVKKSAGTVQLLGKSSEQIGEIIQVIDDIADQTNLLALNAAIEAARAGEQGRGFAVVADEVRKLAERTTKATKEIAEMIKQIQRETTNAVVSMDEGTKEVEKGLLLADNAGASLKQIIEGAGNVVDIITQVAAASEEQSSASEQISKNIEGISSVAEQSAVGITQIAKAAEDLNRLTFNLQELISKFNVGNKSNENYKELQSTKSNLSVRSNGVIIKS
jgi:methyl-accepting chemotaxis protein